MTDSNDTAAIESEIKDLKERGYKVEDLKQYIDALHRLNEVKDSVEIILGKLAEVKGVTIQQMHEEYSLNDLAM